MFKSSFNHPLMSNNIEKIDIKKLINFLNKNQKLTQHKNVKMFEKYWSRWLGTKYSVFVNSGSSANLLSISVLKLLNLKKNKNEIIVPSLTWSSDISSVIHCGFKLKFVDIDLRTLSMDIDQLIKAINKNTAAVFFTHAQGFNGFDKRILDFIRKKKIILIEDVCESHGAKFNKKLGNYGLMSNFSFYYAHHMSTIEGGMISTNNKEIYHKLLALRGHGLVREMQNTKLENYYKKKNKNLSKDFIFIYPGFNLRNTEIGAVLGLSQLKKLNKNIKLRTRNFKFFLKNLDSKKYITDFKVEGSSNYAFPLILKDKNLRNRDLLEKIMNKNGIEFRRGNAGGGNQLRQPYVKKIIKSINLSKFYKVDHVHFFGYYIGNYPTLKLTKIKKICNILNSISMN